MPRIGRRKLLQLSGAGAIAARTGGIAAILASGEGPAYAQGTTVHWLRWNDFIPQSDALLKNQITQQCAKDLGITLNVETINGNDIQARTTAAIQSGSGPDLICALNNWPQLYADSTVDVSDIVDRVGKDQGGFYDESPASRTTASTGWACRGASSAMRAPTANRGSTSRIQQVSGNLGRVSRPSARNSKPRAIRSARRSATASAIRRASGIHSCGRAAAWRSRRTARPW